MKENVPILTWRIILFVAFISIYCIADFVLSFLFDVG